MKDFISFLVTAIVTHKDAVSVAENDSDWGKEFVVHVHKEDMGLVIGKGGKVIGSIRQLTKIIALKNDEHITIRLAEDAS